jgi:hypothetical protein
MQSKEIKKQMKLLEYRKDQLLDHLFSNSEKQLDDFENNIKFKLPNTFENLLYYPYETTLKSLKNGKYSKKEIFKIIYNIVNGKIKDNWGKVYRGVHPAWFLLFCNEFKKKGFNYLPKYNMDDDCFDGIMEIQHDNIHIRDQYIHSFKVYYYLINDSETEHITSGQHNNCDIFKKLYLNLIIEKYVESTEVYSGKYIDMCYVFDNNNTLSIEINENHHNHISDEIRKKQIFARSLDKIIQYYIEESFLSIKKELYKELSKCIYKMNQTIGAHLYMVKINKFNIEDAYQFTALRTKIKNNNLPLSYLLKLCKNVWKITNIDQMVYKMIKTNNLSIDCFIDCNNVNGLLDDEEEIIINKKVKLNNSGLTKILMYPRKNDFEDQTAAKVFITDISNAYGNFMTCYYVMLEDILSNGAEEVQMLHEQYNEDIGVMSMFVRLANLSIDNFKIMCKEVSELEHHPILPYLIKEDKKKVYMKDIAKKFGERGDVYQNLITTIETQQIIKNYRWIDDIEMQDIYEDYDKIKNKNISESNDDSDEIEL